MPRPPSSGSVPPLPRIAFVPASVASAVAAPQPVPAKPAQIAAVLRRTGGLFNTGTDVRWPRVGAAAAALCSPSAHTRQPAEER